jgi:hypothetical protein
VVKHLKPHDWIETLCMLASIFITAVLLYLATVHP